MFDPIKYAVKLDMLKLAAKDAVTNRVSEVMNDRKGITALEYALIASAVVAILIVGYNTFFGNLKSYIEGINFKDRSN